MPPLAVAIPVVTRTHRNGDGEIERNHTSGQWAHNPRTYDDRPLPVKPSDHAPKKALITNRVIHQNGVTYQLKIGDVKVDDVGLEEILDYVSPLDLENFEHREFIEERELLQVVGAEKERKKREGLERQKERAKSKGVVFFEDIDSTEDVAEVGEVEVGKHGRARPTYTHLFKKVKERKRRKRDSDTGELISLSEDENEGISTENDAALQAGVVPSSGPLAEMPKRRRRKRDKVTGELLPLSPVARRPITVEPKLEKKRQRRTRHPLTGELMPIGWRYDRNNDGDSYERRREGLGSHSFRNLSISQEHSVKRQRLDTETSSSRSPSPLPTKAQLAAQHSPLKKVIDTSSRDPQQRNTVVDLLSSDDEPEPGPSSITVANLKPLSQPKTEPPRLSSRRTVASTETSSLPESSPEPQERTSIIQPSASKARIPQRVYVAKTSVLSPSHTLHSSTNSALHGFDNNEDTEHDLDEDEWFIEAILEHRQSDPKTHPPAFGNAPVMLYLVKWEGFEELTWEPLESFGDRSVVTDYRRRVGLEARSNEGEGRIASLPETSTYSPPRTTVTDQRPVTDSNEDDEENMRELDEDEFEVEAIITHHLSDPRTHPPELGRTPVILYKVKWKGWEEPTWEPASSFEDKSVLQQYHERISRKTGDKDHEMD